VNRERLIYDLKRIPPEERETSTLYRLVRGIIEHPKRTAAEHALEIGVSRQRIYQIATNYDLRLPTTYRMGRRSSGARHQGYDHKGVMRMCVQEIHFCGARDTE
jgi:hypothetical protein